VFALPFRANPQPGQLIADVDSDSHSNQLNSAWCNACEAVVMMVTPQQASAISGVTVRTNEH
jgi:hypothetical protein